MPVIYLSGGMHSGWQSQVWQTLEPLEAQSPDRPPDWRILDPSSRMELETPRRNCADHYTAWDLLAIRKADILLAYMEKSNPSGVGMAMEVGYAKALGKTVFFVDGKPEDRRFDIIRASSDALFHSLEEALQVLDSFGFIP